MNFFKKLFGITVKEPGINKPELREKPAFITNLPSKDYVIRASDIERMMIERIFDIIRESKDIIESSKNIDTIISRADVIILKYKNLITYEETDKLRMSNGTISNYIQAAHKEKSRVIHAHFSNAFKQLTSEISELDSKAKMRKLMNYLNKVKKYQGHIMHPEFSLDSVKRDIINAKDAISNIV